MEIDIELLTEIILDNLEIQGIIKSIDDRGIAKIEIERVLEESLNNVG